VVVQAKMPDNTPNANEMAIAPAKQKTMKANGKFNDLVFVGVIVSSFL
jgi:hypothetical protein